MNDELNKAKNEITRLTKIEINYKKEINELKNNLNSSDKNNQK